MKKTNIIKGVVAFSILALLGGGIIAAHAASGGGLVSRVFNKIGKQINNQKGNRGRQPVELTAAQKAARQTEMAAVNAALSAGDYNAWVTAVKAQNANNPVLSKITADNFSRYVEANKLRVQADAIMKELGINQPGMGGFGPGRGQWF